MENKILIIPDVHCRKFFNDAIKNNIDNVSKVVFLGDYVDPYPTDTMEMYDDPIECLEDIIKIKKDLKEKCILLLGNHICHYVWNEFPISTRYNNINSKDYYTLIKNNIELFNLTWVENDIIFSHAGITDFWANEVWETLEFPEDGLVDKKVVAEVFRDTPIKNFSPLYINLIGMIGRIRGGYYKTGSCEWADIREHITKVNGAGQIIPKEYDYYQVFGHTYIKKPLIFDTWACLDCGGKAFIIDCNTHKINEC